MLGLGAVVGFDGEPGPGANQLHDLRELILGQGEDDGDGLDLGHQNQARGIGGVDDVAWVDGADADGAVDGRGDVSVGDVDLGGLNGGLVGLESSGGLSGVRDLELLALPGDDSGLVEGSVTAGLGRHVGGVGFVPGELAFGLGDRCLVGAGVDLGEELALPDRLALADVDREELAVDAALDGDRVVCGYRSECGEIDRDGALDDGLYEDGRGRSARTASAWDGSSGGLGTILLNLPDGSADGCGDDEHEDDLAGGAGLLCFGLASGQGMAGRTLGGRR